MVVAIELIQKAIAPMQAHRFGRIVNITSGTVKLPQAGLDLSSAARGGLTIFLAGVARQVAASNVTINNLLPGAYETERLKTVLGGAAKRKGLSYEDARAERIASIPAKRLGDLDGFGAACAFLCSAQAGFITGQNLTIDGGAYPGVF
jgi:3-oxoacyl-[acyl-carrier protein] reductase